MMLNVAICALLQVLVVVAESPERLQWENEQEQTKEETEQEQPKEESWWFEAQNAEHAEYAEVRSGSAGPINDMVWKFGVYMTHLLAPVEPEETDGIEDPGEIVKAIHKRYPEVDWKNPLPNEQGQEAAFTLSAIDLTQERACHPSSAVLTTHCYRRGL
jgi:hypothetical protein